MSEAASMLKSPLVWIAGGGLGLVLLMTKSANVSGSASGAAAAVTPQYLTASVSMNAAALGAQIDLAQTQADLGKAQLAADVVKQSQYFSYLKALDSTNAVLEGKRMETDAGITSALIASSTAIVLDQQGNANRLGLAWAESAKSAHTDNANVEMTRLKAKAAKSVAKSNMFGSIAGSVAKVATAFA